MNAIDEAIRDLLDEIGGNWALVKVEPAGSYQLVGDNAANYVYGVVATLRHDELGVEVTGLGATLGLAVANAVLHVNRIAVEVKDAP